MILRFNKSSTTLCIAIVLTVAVVNSNPVKVDVAAKPGEVQARDVWVKQRLLSEKSQPPFSFVYGGRKSEELLPDWPRKAKSEKLNGVRTQHTLVWTDPKTGLQIRCVAVEYADFPAVDWVLHLSNTGGQDTPIIEQIRPLDLRIESRGQEGFTIHHSLGDSNSGKSFAPVDDVLTPAKPGPLAPAPNGGRSSDGCMPYFNVDWRTGGIAAAVGWSGQWEAAFQVNPDGALQFRAGQQLTHLKLHPGETIRTPRILFVFWEGSDPIRGNNLFRRVMMAHYMPRHEGKLVLPPICASVGWTEPDGTYEKPHVNAMKPLADRGIEVFWSDMDPQQWYPKGFPEGTGTWEPDPAKYPNGLKPVGDAAKAAGIGYLLWFEPERVHPGSKIDCKHPEFVMKAQGEWSQLFRLNDEKARKWLTDHIDVQITAAQITWLRWDFNVPPLGFWRRNDEPDRQGMTEIRYIEGLYAMWDDLRARHPGLMIDNCASGGRRIDIETCSRSVPLWHSDMQCSETNPAADQLQNGGLNRWVPMHGCGNVGLEPSYVFRSAMTAGNVLVAAGSKADLNDAKCEAADAVRRTVAVYNNLRPMMAGDFYPLFPHDESLSQWYGYQFDNPDLRAGCAMLFRRDKCPDAGRTIRLNGIDPAASYEVANLDEGTPREISGKDLLEKGLTVEIKTKPGAALIIYKQKQNSLPFAMTTAVRPNVSLVKPQHIPDSPDRHVTIDGQVWVVYAPNPYVNPTTVARYRGADLEHLVQQPDGRFDCSDSPLPGGRQASSFVNSGLWYDKSTSTLYALLHTEYEHDGVGKMAGWCRKKVRLATSKDLGLNWTLVGDVLTSCYPDLNDWTKFSGTEFEVGPADYELYVDERGGYFYVSGWNGWIRNKGQMDVTQLYIDVARCPIRDKMAPGKWHKFCNGTWTEPGLRGKSSRVPMDHFGLYGGTIYSSYLKKYVRIGVILGTADRDIVKRALSDGSVMISTCTDLALQDWSPAAKLLDHPANRAFGFTLAAADKKNGVECGQKFHVYNYWSGQPNRVIDVTLGEGTTPVIPVPAGPCYSYEPHPEAGDSLECRQTKIVGSESPEMSYSGSGWSVEKDAAYFQGEARKCSTAGNSLSFSFKGADVYWRAVAANDAGKTDVSIDGVPQATVDCYFRDPACNLPKMFAFIKKGLDPHATHTITIAVRGDANPASKGTAIRHIGFEYSAESYRAQAGFSSIQGKNQWRYQSWDGNGYSDLPTYDLPAYCWRGAKCSIGSDWQRPETARSSPARKWIAPHDGIVCVDGLVGSDTDKVIWDPVVTYVDALGDNKVPANSGSKYRVSMKKNAESLVALELGPNATPTTYKVYVKVAAGDSIYFVASFPPPAKNHEKQ